MTRQATRAEHTATLAHMDALNRAAEYTKAEAARDWEECQHNAWPLIRSIKAQLADPTYEARRADGQASLDALFDKSRDAALIALGYIDAPEARA